MFKLLTRAMLLLFALGLPVRQLAEEAGPPAAPDAVVESAEAASPALPSPEWAEADAAYRLTVIPEQSGEAAYVDLRRQLLPVEPQHGVAVLDDQGRPIAYQLHPNGSLAIAPCPDATYYTVYFGFAEPRPFDTWKPESGPRPPAQRLRLEYGPGRNRFCTSQEYLAFRLDEIKRQNRWHEQNFYKRPFRILWQYHTGMEPVSRPPNIQQFYRNRNNIRNRMNTKNKNQRMNACLELVGRPYMWRMYQFNHNCRTQMRNHLTNIHKERTRIEGLRAQAHKDQVFAPERELIGIQNWGNPHVMTEVQMLVRPPETPEHYTARFSGFLQIREAGDYEFELMTNSLTILQLNGQIAAKRTQANGSQPVEVIRETVTLQPGSVPFELFYRLNSGYGAMTVRMREPGQDHFEMLATEHFTPARAARPVRLENRDRLEFPLVAAKGHYLLYTGKTAYQPVESFLFDSDPAELEWSDGDDAWSSCLELPEYTVPSVDPARPFRIRACGRPETALPVTFTGYRADLVELRPALALKLWFCDAVYEDEGLALTAEAQSRLPFPVEPVLEVRLDGKLIESRRIRLDAKPDERFDRAAADIYRKEAFHFTNGTTAKTGMVEVTLRLGGFVFDRKQLLLLPVAAAGLGNGEVPGTYETAYILKRPRLSDLRNWELPRRVETELRRSGKLLVVCESSRGLQSELAALQEETGGKLELLTWRAGDRPLKDSLNDLLRKTANHDAERVLLILPCQLHNAALEPWMRDRYLAALLEKVSRTPREPAVAIAMPPHLADDDIAAREELRQALLRLARDYGAQVLDSAAEDTRHPSATVSQHPPELFHAHLRELLRKL